MIIIQKHLEDETNNNLADYDSFKSKLKITGKVPADRNTKSVEIIVPIKY